MLSHMMSSAVPSVSVLVPYDSPDMWRMRDWNWVNRYIHLNYRGWQVCVGKCQDEWCRPEAIIDAYSQSHGDILIVWEPDSVSFGLPSAVQAVVTGAHRWAVGHTQKHRLTELATEIVLGGWMGDISSLPTIEPPYTLVPGNTGLVMERSLFEQVPPDATFLGWGAEDQAWGMALTELAGPEYRSSAPLVHFYHPNEGRDDSGNWNTSPETKRRFMKYERAVNHPDRMRELVAQAREYL